MIEAPVTYLPLTDGGAFLWILLLLAVVWFAPTPYELFSESRPCLDANRLEKLGRPHLQSPILSQTKKLLTLIDGRDIISSAGLKLTLIAVLGGTCALIVLVRGTQTPAFIYMFFRARIQNENDWHYTGKNGGKPFSR